MDRYPTRYGVVAKKSSDARQLRNTREVGGNYQGIERSVETIRV
jgi:hypothetical protein